MTAYFAALKKAGITDAEIQSIIDKLNQKLLKTQQKTDKELEQALEKAQNVQISNYLDTLDDKNKEITKSELKLQEDIAALNAAGFTDITNALIANKLRVEAINKKYNDKEIEEARRKDEKIARDAEVIDNRQLQNSLDALKIQSDVATKIANSSGKATSSERIAILNEYKNSLYDLASIGGWTAEQFDKIEDALRNVDAAIAGSKDNLKDYEVSWTETVNTINKAILDFVINSVTSLGESLGKLLAGEKIQPFVAITEMLADALSQIGKALITLAITQKLALISLSNPLSWPVALGAGIAAVAAGAYLKSKLNADKTKKFANGGIISGPTMGLMGEYPGAQNNPEVVAPLDKLKSLIGGGGGNGQFILRGQDLVLALQRSNSSLTLRR